MGKQSEGHWLSRRRRPAYLSDEVPLDVLDLLRFDNGSQNIIFLEDIFTGVVFLLFSCLCLHLFYLMFQHIIAVL